METLARYVSYKIHNLLKENQNLQITSVYIGGGTPNSVKSRAYSSLFAEFSPYLAPQAEISIEANPNSLSLEWLQTLQSLGVNRLSLGAQSFEDSKLIFLERHHRKDSIFYAIEMALKAGLKNLSIDLIYGTPLCNASLLTQELETACALPLSHLSAYQLSIDEGSRFYANKESLGNLRDFEGEFEGFLSMGHFIKSYLQIGRAHV